MYPRLLGDVGGTNVRFAWQAEAGQPLERLMGLPADAFAGISQAIAAYLAQQNLPRPRAACVGVATPVLGDEVRMTNRAWSFSIQALARELGVSRLKVINDFTALALALPGLLAEERVPLGGPVRSELPRQPLALLGPGTGLGVGGLLPVGTQGWQPLAGEGGHVTLAAHTELEWRLIERLREAGGHVSAERVLSGAGLVRLHQALRQEMGEGGAAPVPADRIVQAALQAGDARALQTLELFCGFLGSVAGDLALTLGARGGVYLGGGMLPHLLGWLERSGLRVRFEAKGRFERYLREVPLWVIRGQMPALRGAALALDMDGLT